MMDHLPLPNDDPILFSRPSVPNLKELLHHLVEWQIFAIHLPGINESDIRTIERERPSSIALQKLDLFAKWLELDPNASWGSVLIALAKARLNALSVHVYNSITRSKSPASTEQVVLDSELSIIKKIQELYRNFTEIVTNVRMKLASLIENKERDLILISVYIEEFFGLSDLTEAKNIHNFFTIIRPHYCFLNCHLIQELVERFIPREDELHSQLQQYLDDLLKFLESVELQQIKEAIKKAFIPMQSVTETTCSVEMKLHERWNKITLENFKKVLDHIFDMESKILNHLQVNKGCICVSFIAPLSHSQSLIDKVSSKKFFMRATGIFEVSINKQLIKSGTVEEDIDQCLFEVAKNGDHFCAFVLLKLGANINHFYNHCINKSRRNYTALMIASLNNHYKVVEMLLDHDDNDNTNVDIQNETGWTALMFAGKEGHFEVVGLLLKKNCKVDIQNKRGWTALMLACSKGHYEVVKLLVDETHQIDIQEEEGSTALLLASESGNYQIVDLLLSRRARVDAQNKEKATSLMFACQNGHHQVVKLLLCEDADVNIKNKENVTSLMLASQYGHDKVVELLLSYQADVDVQNEQDETALMLASKTGHFLVVKLLLENQAMLDIQDNYGWTALMYACSNGHVSVVQLLLEKGADINVETEDECNALMLATSEGHYEIIELLLDKHPNLQALEAALMLAYEQDHEVFELLHQSVVATTLVDSYQSFGLM